MAVFGGHDGSTDLDDLHLAVVTNPGCKQSSITCNTPCSTSNRERGGSSSAVLPTFVRGCAADALWLAPAVDSQPAPVARRFHTFVGHENSELAVLFGTSSCWTAGDHAGPLSVPVTCPRVCAGGCYDREYHALGDMWVLTGLSVSPTGQASYVWVDMAARTTGSPPLPRWGHGATMVHNVMFVFGGRHGVTDLNDLALFTFDCTLTLAAVMRAS